MPLRLPQAGASALRRASLWRAFRASKRSATSLAIFESPARASCASRSFATRSASAVASVDSDAFRGNAARAPAASAASAAAEPASDASNDMMFMLEQSIAERQPSEALAYYNCLQSPPSGLTSQKLAILLAKQDSLHQTRRAFEILQNVYGSPEFEVDDYTQLASIYIVDACLRQKLLPEALEIFDHAHKSDISLDLPAYDGIVRALVADDQIARAREVLVEIMAKRQVVLEQQTFQPLLLRLMERAEYDAVIDVIDHGRKHGVLFTFETYDPLVEMGELVDDSEDEDLWDELERFMAYINEALEEDGLTSLSDDEDEGDDVTVEVAYDDDDDDDDSDDFGDDFDDHKY